MHTGIVKSVISGDSLVIMGADASKGPPPEKLLTLNILAPRMGNRGGTPDQPFAWAAREFLRQEVIGKRVSFSIDGQHASNREFGSVYLENGTSLATLMLTHGWAKLKMPPSTEPRTPEFEELAEISRRAEEGKVGMFTQVEGAAAASIRNVQWGGTFDHAALLQQFKDVPQDAIIEQVLLCCPLSLPPSIAATAPAALHLMFTHSNHSRAKDTCAPPVVRMLAVCTARSASTCTISLTDSSCISHAGGLWLDASRTLAPGLPADHPHALGNQLRWRQTPRRWNRRGCTFCTRGEVFCGIAVAEP